MRGPSVSFGGHGGFHGGPGFAGRGFSGRGFSGHGFSGHGFSGHGFRRRPFFPARRFNHDRFFFGYPGIYAYPYFGYPYYDTLGFGYSSYDSSSNDDAAAYGQNQQLSQQLYKLDSEIRDLRDQNEQLRYDLERRYRGDEQPQPASRPQSAQATPEIPSAVFVFKDGVRLDAHGYAIVGQTLWILSPQRALKYPLAQLDFDATKKANADRGLDLNLPGPVSTPAKPPTNSPPAIHGD
jgi:hypothetical protein